MTPHQTAQVIAGYRLGRRPMPALDLAARPPDEQAAYAVQDALHPLLAGPLGPVAGHKIGCTTAVMQAFLSIPNPCGGGVFERTVHTSPARVHHGDFLRVGVECEIVVRLGHDLPPRQRRTTATRWPQRSRRVRPAWKSSTIDTSTTNLDTPTLIADDFFDAACVLGTAATDWRTLDLSALTGSPGSMAWRSVAAVALTSWDIP